MRTGHWPRAEIDRFFESFFYSREAFQISEVLEADPGQGLVRARVDAHAPWLVAPHQRGSVELHPRHVSGPDLIMLTASLGALHAWFFHGCRWDEGWVGFGNRIETAEFKSLARVGEPLDLRSVETKVRKGPKRVLIEFDFEFSQLGKSVYLSKQLAMFLKSDPSKAPTQS